MSGWDKLGPVEKELNAQFNAALDAKEKAFAPEFIVKDSGAREEFPTGAVRDTQDGKPRPDLISPFFLMRLGKHLELGAKKYTPSNWRRGLPVSRCYASAMRHLVQWGMGMTDEDHLSAVAFNIMAIVHFEETGRTDLDDRMKFPDEKEKLLF